MSDRCPVLITAFASSRGIPKNIALTFWVSVFFHIRMHLRNSRDSLVSCNPSTLTHIRRKIQPATLRGPTEWRLFPGSLVYLTCVRWPQWEEWVYLSSLDPFPILRSDRETTWVQPRKWKQDELLEIPFHPTSWQMMNPSLRGTQPTQLISLEDPSALLSFNEEASTLNYEKKWVEILLKVFSFLLFLRSQRSTLLFFFFFFGNSEVSWTACCNR